MSNFSVIPMKDKTIEASFSDGIYHIKIELPKLNQAFTFTLTPNEWKDFFEQMHIIQFGLDAFKKP